MEWMILPLRRYFDFAGRSRRTEYWAFFVFSVLVGVATGIIDVLLGFGRTSSYETGSAIYWAYQGNGPVNALASLALLIPSIAVSVRRLHDTDRRGWWLLLIFVPIVGWIVLFVFFVLDGTRGPNRFGADPKDPAGVRDVNDVFG